VTQARFNRTTKSDSAKAELLAHVETKLGHQIRPTPLSEQKFNVFEIRPGGGW
jgi:hypothetical protein